MKCAVLSGSVSLFTEHLRLIPSLKSDRSETRGLVPSGQRFNMGDWFVRKATREVLDPEEIYRIHPKASDADFKTINRLCDVCLIKGGNYIQRGLAEKHLPLDVLKRIDIPIVYIGAGLQAKMGSMEPDLTTEDIEVLRRIHRSCVSCMVRGESTASYLESLGIYNFDIVGCPTLFLSRQPTLRVRPPSFEHVGWTFRHRLYSDVNVLLNQMKAMAALKEKAGVLTVLLQGEETALQAWYAYHTWNVRERWLDEKLKGTHIVRTVRQPIDERDILRHISKDYPFLTNAEEILSAGDRFFFSFDPADYEQMVQSCSFVAGCRLHGNLISAALGTPVFYYLYDERVMEMVKLLGLPYRRLSEDNLEIRTEDLDYTTFEDNYVALYKQYEDFFEKNSIRHTLAPSSGS